ncbi:hypothetical protein ACH5RR_024103 [Cinchona calisaya]|uniref:Protein kinase domain-containing protein n=1 Tax=Cinchona calisaya TaxID=153742 RepID=A0ABD2ZCK7_9GENT
MVVVVPTHGGRYVQYNVYGNLFEVSRKYVPPIRPLGRGAYGIVCAIVNSETRKEVAIKKIGNAFDNRIDAKRTLREIKLLRHMDHDNVIAIKDIIRPPQKENFNDVYIIYELAVTDLFQIFSDDHFLSFFGPDVSVSCNCINFQSSGTNKRSKRNGCCYYSGVVFKFMVFVICSLIMSNFIDGKFGAKSILSGVKLDPTRNIRDRQLGIAGEENIVKENEKESSSRKDEYQLQIMELTKENQILRTTVQEAGESISILSKGVNISHLKQVGLQFLLLIFGLAILGD